MPTTLTLQAEDDLDADGPGAANTGSRDAAIDVTFNFRDTSNYVTDGANQIYVLSGDTYPTTRGGFTFGWVNGTHAIASVNRDNSVDPRLAGANYVDDYNGGTATYFRVDLPAAGTYNIRLAIGQMGFGGTNQFIEIKDTTTSLFTVNAGSVSSSTFTDAQTVNYSAANWPSSNSSRSAVFSTTQLRMLMGQGTTADTQVIACIGIAS